MNKARFYKAELLIKDTFEDNELGEESEISTSEIAEFLTNELPFGFKIVKKSVKKLLESEIK